MMINRTIFNGFFDGIFNGAINGSELLPRQLFLILNGTIPIAWFPASLFKLPRGFTACSTRMHIRFVRRRYATMVEISHSLATLNSNSFLVYGLKHKVSVLVF